MTTRSTAPRRATLGLAVSLAFVLLAAAPARAQDASPNTISGLTPVFYPDGAIPQWQFLAASFASTFKEKPPYPTPGIVVDYRVVNGELLDAIEEDSCVVTFELKSSGLPAENTEIKLRPGPIATHDWLVCEPKPVTLDPVADAGACFVVLEPLSNTTARVRIQYFGHLEAGFGWTVQRLELVLSPECSEATIAGFTEDFDSDAFGASYAADLPGVTPVDTRLPASVLLVLDKSGSMRRTVCDPATPCATTRWDVVKDAVDAAMTAILPYVQTDFTVGGITTDGDRFAAVPFSDVVDADPAFEALDWQEMTPGPVGELALDLDAITPSGWTSFGAGMQYREADFVAATERKQVVLLFTDGRQNRPPQLRFEGGYPKIFPTMDLFSGTIYAWDSAASEVKAEICPFVMNADDPADGIWTELEDIADAHCDGMFGSSIHLDTAFDGATGAVDPSGLQQFFVQVVQNALQGDKLEMADTMAGRMTYEETRPERRHTFHVGRQDPNITLLVTWEGDYVGIEELLLVKDGETFGVVGYWPPDSPVRQIPEMATRWGNQFLAVTIAPPLGVDSGDGVSFDGEWELRLRPWMQSESFTYHVLVTSDNTRLATAWSASQGAPGVGEPIVLEAQVREAGVPVTTLGGGGIVARVRGPESGLGNVLSVSAVDPIVGSGERDDPISLAGDKVAAMLQGEERARLLAAIGFTNERTVELSHVGNGIYRGQFVPNVEGAYRVDFTLDGETPDNGRITRVFHLVKRVAVIPSADETPVAIERLPNNCGVTATSYVPPTYAGGCWRVVLEPRDALGNLVGPGKTDQLQLTSVDDERAQHTVTDNLDGTYTVVIGYHTEPGHDPYFELFGTRIRVDIAEADNDPDPDPGETCVGNCCCDPTARTCRQDDRVRALTLALGLAAALFAVGFVWRRRRTRS